MARTSSLIRFTLCAAAAVTFAACGKGDADKSAEAAEELPMVEIDFARSQDVPQQKEYTANVEAYNVNNISPSSPNRIKTIAVEVGDPVRRGQTLVTLDRANIDQLKINLDQIEREYNRAVKLLEIGGGTQQSVDQLKAQLDAARTQYANAMENTVLTSPVSSVGTARNYDPGDMTGTQPVLTVGQLSPVVKVIINATESDLTKITRGKQVNITFDALPDGTFTGTVPAPRHVCPRGDRPWCRQPRGRARPRRGKADRQRQPLRLCAARQQGELQPCGAGPTPRRHLRAAERRGERRHRGGGRPEPPRRRRARGDSFAEKVNNPIKYKI